MYLEIRNLSKSFQTSGKETLQDISLEIREGEFICIVGPSGCGKTTLLNIIAGLDKPTAGGVYLEDREVSGPGADRTVIFQETALYPWLNVQDNVMFGMKMAGLPKKKQEEQAEKYLKMVHLWEFRNYAVHEISGGMKQRVSLARALAMDSKIILMDEPFSALDKQTINILREELELIWQETHKTILFITHSVEEAVYFADRVIVLADNPGRIKEIYPVQLPRPRHIEEGEFLTLRKQILSNVRKEAEIAAEVEYDKE